MVVACDNSASKTTTESCRPIRSAGIEYRQIFCLRNKENLPEDSCRFEFVASDET